MTSADLPVIQLNPALDRADIAARLRRTGRVRIRDLFPDPVARRLHRCLATELPWNTVFNEGDGKVHTLFPNQVAAMTADQKSWLTNFVFERARTGFQFIFNSYPVWDLADQGKAPDLYVFRLLDFLNGPEFLSFIHEISGITGIVMADAQATLFQPHHFLTRHSDRDEAKGRRMAYVLNLTPAWRAEWGGLLEFLDEAGDVAEGFTPCFNTLNLFTVPAPHHVSYVTPFADGGRYSVTGWLRDRR